VRGLSHRFGEHQALEPTDLEVEPGGVVGLLGPNGSGKSTLMRLLTGLVPLQRGEVVVDGAPLRGDGLEIRRRTTYAPGELHLYGELKGDEHLRFLLRGREGGALARAREVAVDLGLPLDRRVRDYSHGMKRQLLFAAAIAPQVRVRILDEISEGLDPAKRSQVLDLIDADAASGTTILLSSHHLGEVDRSCERLVFLNAGRVVADERAEDVRRRAGRLVRLRFHGAPAGLSPEAVRVLEGPEVESVEMDGERVTVLLAEDDPRAFLGRLAAARDLPAPASVEHGRISLSELYRTLYGVEGT
jgi:ABC-2 type transport system ATP-binding protein